AAAEAVDDLADGFGSDTLRRLDAAVDVGAAFDFVAHVAFFFEALEHGPRGRFLHRVSTGEGFADVFGGAGRLLPDDLHDEGLELAETFLCAKHCSATKCSAIRGACQGAEHACGYSCENTRQAIVIHRRLTLSLVHSLGPPHHYRS